MPRDGSGVYSLPAGLTAVAGETIQPEQINSPLGDIASELTASLPRNGVAGMTGDLNMGTKKIVSLANGAADADAVNKLQMETYVTAQISGASFATPVGLMSEYAGSTAPTGWLLCQGQAVSRVTEAALFAVIGTTYGAGDGSTTFNVPDMRGVFPRGVDASRGLDSGRALGSYQADQIASHGHTGSASSSGSFASHSHGGVLRDGGYYANGGGSNVGNIPLYSPGNTDATSGSISVSTSITINNGGSGSDTRPKNLAVNYIIKT